MQQSALRSLAIVCDYMETTLFAIVCDLRFAIRDRLRSYGNQPLSLQRVISSVAMQWNSRYRDQLLLDYDSILLHGLNDYIKYCAQAQFSWCAVTQVPPLNIDYNTAAYSSRSQTVSQAVSFTEVGGPTRRPVRSESRTVLCYLWPTLQD